MEEVIAFLPYWWPPPSAARPFGRGGGGDPHSFKQRRKLRRKHAAASQVLAGLAMVHATPDPLTGWLWPLRGYRFVGEYLRWPDSAKPALAARDVPCRDWETSTFH